MNLPSGLDPVEGPKGWGFAAPEARELAALVLARGRKLRDWAAAQPGALALQGRGPVHAVPSPVGGHWVVRPYRRGGVVAAPLLGDRYVRLGVPRPLAEACASAEVEARAIPTPRVLAGVLYPSGAFYRADIVTQYIPASRDLAAALFQGAEGERPERSHLLEEAGRLVGRMARAGVEHPDLNARNILFAREGEAPVAMLLDLDRCRLRRRGAQVAPWHMLNRLERSLRKISEQKGVSLTEPEWEELRRAVMTP